MIKALRAIGQPADRINLPFLIADILEESRNITSSSYNSLYKANNKGSNNSPKNQSPSSSVPGDTKGSSGPNTTKKAKKPRGKKSKSKDNSN